MAGSADRLTLLTSFSRVADLGSLSAAARDLGLSQPSVTRHIASLEALLGAQLLHRTPHAVTLTPAGEATLADARALLAEWDAFAAHHGETGAVSGPLRVIVPVALGQTVLADAAAAFQARFPDVTLDWRLTDGPVNLVTEGADCWIKVGHIHDDRLVLRLLCQITRRAVLSPGADRGRMIALGGFETAAPVLRNQTGAVLKPAAQVVFRSDNFMAAYRQVLAGSGFGVFPDWFVAEDLRTGRLIDLAPGYAADPTTLSVGFLPGVRPARLDAFLDHLAQAVVGLGLAFAVDASLGEG
jgi:DNA-binding transcriptional LysR family regulator